MHSTSYIIRFILIITSVAALLLAGLFTLLKPKHDLNEAIYNKRAILRSIEQPLGQKVDDLSDEDVTEIFNTQVEQVVIDVKGEPVAEAVIMERGYSGIKAEDIDMAKEKKRPLDERLLPVFIFTKGEDNYYVISVRGSGLWDEIWGNIALSADLSTIAGTAFDHKAETPGLGAEIKDNSSFSRQFIGKEVFSDKGDFESVRVLKVADDNDPHAVDGISGATITCNGVSDMLESGIQNYIPYIEKVQASELN